MYSFLRLPLPKYPEFEIFICQIDPEINPPTDKGLYAIADALITFLINRQYITDNRFIIVSFIKHKTRSTKNIIIGTDDQINEKYRRIVEDVLASNIVVKEAITVNIGKKMIESFVGIPLPKIEGREKIDDGDLRFNELTGPFPIDYLAQFYM